MKRFLKQLNEMLPKRDFVLFFLVLFYILIFALLLQNSFSYLDPDLGWHLASGKGALGGGGIPLVNHSNYTLAGQEWVNHEWLTDVFVYNIYNQFGYLVLTIIFALLVVLVLAGLHFFTQRYFSQNNSLFLLLFLILWGVLGMAPQLGVRMQEATLLFLPLLLIILFFYTRKRTKKTLLWLPPLMYLWACLHGGFLIGIFLLFAFPAIKVGEALIYRKYHPYFLSKKELLTYSEIKIYGIFALFAFIPTFFTPYGTKLYSFLGGYTNTFYLTHIKEWLPQYFIHFNYFQISYIALVTVVAGFYIFYGLNRQKKEYKIDVWQLFLMILFLVMSVKSRRHFPLLFVGTFPLVVDFLSSLLNVRGRSFLFKLSLWMKAYLVVCLVISIAFIALKIDFTYSPFNYYCQDYPCRAVSFLKDNPEYKDLNLLAEYGWGGYLIWKYPEGRLFIDGRMPQYQINDSTILEEYYKFFDKEKIGEQLDKYNVEMILMKNNPPLRKMDKIERLMSKSKNVNREAKQKFLIRYLSKEEKWKKIFENDISIIYVNQNKYVSGVLYSGIE